MTFDATLKAEAAKKGAQIYPALTITFPDRTRRYAAQGLASASNGLYDPRVLSWGTVTRGSTDRSGRLQPVETRVRIDDTDFDFAKLRYGTQGGRLYGSAARIDLASPNAVAGQIFGGVYADAEFGNARDVTLILRVNDLPLQSATPKVQLARDFANCKSDVLAMYAGPIYGTHDATGLASTGGAVSCPYVDTVNYRYYVCLGRAKTIRRVYSAGTLKTSGTDYSVLYLTTNGRTYTLINFGGLGGNQNDNAITVDLDGVETVGDGSGSTIHNPVTQLKHFLVNYVWNNYQSGVYFADGTAPIDTTSFSTAASFLDTIGYQSSRRVSGSQVKGIDLVNEVADQLNLRFYWTQTGTLGVYALDFRATSIYVDDPWVRDGDGMILGDFAAKPDPAQLADRLAVKYCFLDEMNGFSQTIEIRDSSQDIQAAESVEMRWSPAHIV